MSARRLAITAVDGRLTLRDEAQPGAPLVALSLSDGRTIALAEHLCGWRAAGADDPLWPSPDEARAAFEDDDDLWLATLEAAAALAPPAPPAPLPAAEDIALNAIRERHPGAWIDGPLRDQDGRWQMIVSGNSDLGCLIVRGDSPLRAARDLLDRISAHERQR